MVGGGFGRDARRMARFVLLSDAQFSLIANLRPGPARPGPARPDGPEGATVRGRQEHGRGHHFPVPDRDHLEGTSRTRWIPDGRCGPDIVGSAGRHTWDVVLYRPLTAADVAGQVDWSVSVSVSVSVYCTIDRAHRHATNITRTTGGCVESHGSGTLAA